jgi:hypothetical protein
VRDEDVAPGIDVESSHGVQVGDGNTQVNNWLSSKPRLTPQTLNALSAHAAIDRIRESSHEEAVDLFASAPAEVLVRKLRTLLLTDEAWVVAILADLDPGKSAEIIARTRLAYEVSGFGGDYHWPSSGTSGQTRGSWFIRPTLVLSADVRMKYRDVISAAGGTPDDPSAWTLNELSKLQRKTSADDGGASKAAAVLAALGQAIEAKTVFLAVGGSRLELGQLQVIYRREIGAWPAGASADALLAEAASAGMAEHRSPAARRLSALARFLIGVAAALEESPDANDLLAGWLTEMGHQLADARAHYRASEDGSAWLLIDLGDEPQHGAIPWPAVVTWTLLSKDDAITGEPVQCEPTADGLRQALAFVLRQIPPARPLLVDLALPRALMEEGIEHWPLIEVDGLLEPLSVECRPRLRWSRRRRDARLHNRVLDHLGQATWEGEVKRWARKGAGYACFVGGQDALMQEDQLRQVLREGYGFALWFASGLTKSALGEASRAVRSVPVHARRDVLPDHLPGFSGSRVAVIWDDPRGRGRFQLPPLLTPESP